MKELVIKLRMDRSQAARASQDQIDSHRKMGDSAEEAGRRTRKANTAAYTEAQVQAKATAQIAAKANADRVQAAIKAAAEETKAHKGTGSSILEMAAAAGIAEKGFQGLLKVANGIRDAFQEADKYARGLRGAFTDERENVAELAAIMGKQPDNAFVASNAAYNTATGFKPREGISFRSQFQNSGAQFAGRNISPEEYAEYEKQAGQVSVARGMDPKESGDFFGKILGLRDFSKSGKNASEEALAVGNASIEILKRGSGDNAVLIKQLNMLNSSLLNDDEMKGVIKDPNVSASLISTAAESNPEEAFTTIQAAIAGLRDFNDKDAKPILDRAGINPRMDPIQAARALAPVVEQEAREKGLKVDDVLKEYFHNRLTSRGIGVLINKGVNGGIFSDREALAAGTIPGIPAISGVGPALDTIGQYQKSERGQLRVSEAATKEAELGLGAQNSRLQTLQEQAKKNLIARGETGTTGAEIVDFLTSMATFGTLDPKQGRLEDEMSGIIARRAAKVGLDAYSYAPAVTRGAMTAEGINANLNTALTAVEAAELAASIKEANRLQAEANAMMRKNAPPAVPVQLAAPRPVVDRNP